MARIRARILTVEKGDSKMGMGSLQILYNTRNSAQCYVAAWMGREFGGEFVVQLLSHV